MNKENELIAYIERERQMPPPPFLAERILASVSCSAASVAPVLTFPLWFRVACVVAVMVAGVGLGQWVSAPPELLFVNDSQIEHFTALLPYESE